MSLYKALEADDHIDIVRIKNRFNPRCSTATRTF